MSGRICVLLQAPSLAEAQAQQTAVTDSQELFGGSVTSTTTAVAGTVLGVSYLVVRGPHDTIQDAVSEDIPEDWDEVEATRRDGSDDASSTTWLPSHPATCLILGSL